MEILCFKFPGSRKFQICPMVFVVKCSVNMLVLMEVAAMLDLCTINGEKNAYFTLKS